MKFLFLFFTLIFLIFQVGCAGSPAVEKYPERYIDRPYTLPKGLASWETYAVYSYYFKNDPSLGSSTNNYAFAWPFSWHESLSDDWTLWWMPFPLGLDHQISKSNTDIFGASVLAGFSYSTTYGFSLRPTLTVFDRHIYERNFAIEHKLNYTPVLPFGTESYGYQLEYFVGPLFQLTNTSALSPRVGLSYELRPIQQFIDNSTIPADTTASLVAPVELWYELLLSRQWDFTATYHFDGIGYASGYTRHSLLVGFINYW